MSFSVLTGGAEVEGPLRTRRSPPTTICVPAPSVGVGVKVGNGVAVNGAKVAVSDGDGVAVDEGPLLVQAEASAIRAHVASAARMRRVMWGSYTVLQHGGCHAAAEPSM